jgi:hypothetical protein
LTEGKRLLVKNQADHTKLGAFELAEDVAVLVYRLTAEFPREGLYDLTS